MRALLALFAVCGVGLAVAGAGSAAPVAGSELLVMNDGMKPVREVRVRQPGPDGIGAKGGWSENLLGGDEVIAVNEGRRFDLAAMNLGCEVEIRLEIEGRAAPVKGELGLCDEPRFWVGFALGLDDAGMGVRPGVHAVVVGEDEDMPAPSPDPGMTGGVSLDLNRGLPICPGDPRCRKKK